MDKTISTAKMYEGYKGPHSKETFKKVCKEFNKQVIEFLIEGYSFELGHHLASFKIVRCERSFKKPRVNWGESNKLKAKLLEEGKQLYDSKTGEGEQWIVFFTDDFFCKVHWEKYRCKVPNKSAYEFVPSRGLKGLSTKLKEHLNKHELNYQDYSFL